VRGGHGRLDVWPPLPPDSYLRGSADAANFPLGEPGVTLYSRARHALFLGVRAVGLLPGDDILTPAYHHGSEVEALTVAGLHPRFYDATETLEPNEAEITQVLTTKTRALYIIHYLGFPQDAGRWRRFCDEHGLLLIEDAAQAWLASRDGRPVGSHGDLTIFCLYKAFGIPDGAALLVRRGAPLPTGRDSRVGIRDLCRSHALWLIGRSRLASRAVAPLEGDGEYSVADDFALGTPEPPTVAARSLLRRVPVDVAARRRAHYRLLLEHLDGEVPRPFDQIPPGSSPFAFPVATSRKADLLDRLGRAGIRALDFWSVPHPSLPADRYPGAAERRRTTVGLPVHHELRLVDIERVWRAARRHRPSSGYRLEWIDGFDSARDDWRRIAARGGNVFATWEWASLWWRRYGTGKPLIVSVRRPGEEPFAILPLYLWRDRPLRVLRFLGHGPADEVGPVCAAADRSAAASALRQVLAKVKSDLLFADHLPGEESWSALLGGAVVRREGYPLIRGARTWDDYLSSRSSHFRKKLLWQERRLAREHRLRFSVSDSADRLASDLDVLFTLHAARWPAPTQFLLHESFHREFAACALEAGWLRLWFLELDEQPVAAWYGFRFSGIESHLQSGRDPRIRDSIGSVLLVHTIREALNDGVTEYRFLRGGEDYKGRFATDDPGLETVGVACTRAGRCALAAGRLSLLIPPVRTAVGARLSDQPLGGSSASIT
jgi:CelD/BcsL family acetyltransferase involved in cellulose biosynthesis